MDKNKVNKLNKAVTSNDVAKLAGVSQSSVSRTFNPNSQKTVNDEIAQKVMRAAQELGYVPNLLARSISSGESGIIGLVVGGQLGPFYLRVIDEFIIKVQELGKQCIVFKIPSEEELENIIEKVIQYHVEGVIVTASVMTKGMVETLRNNDIPIVLFNRYITTHNINIVYVNHMMGGKLAAEKMVDAGHNRIGYIQSLFGTTEEIEKKIGFITELRNRGVYAVAEEESVFSYEGGREAGKRMLSLEEPPTAIFCASDLIAMGVVDVAKTEFGLRVPDDLAVIGYDDIDMASWDAYQLTTIRQPQEKAIELSVEILRDKIKNSGGKEVLKVLEPELIIRKSV